MQKVGDLISSALKSNGLKTRYTAESVIFHWAKIVGPELSRQTRAYKIQSGVLVIIVTNSVWCHHLSMMKNDIITKINAFSCENLVKDIRFLAGVLENDQNIEQNVDNGAVSITQKLKNVSLDEHDIVQTRNMVAEVKDEKLRKKILWVLQKEFLFKKVKQKEKWHHCEACGTLCPPDDKYCAVCQRELRHNKLSNVRKFLLDTPWMDYQEAGKYINCTQDEFYKAKRALIDEMQREVYRNHADILKTNILVMLMTGIKPGDFDEEFVNTTLKKIRGKKYVPAFRS